MLKNLYSFRCYYCYYSSKVLLIGTTALLLGVLVLLFGLAIPLLGIPVVLLDGTLLGIVLHSSPSKKVQPKVG